MDVVTMEDLLRADEEKLRSELRADDLIDKNRALSVERLRGAFGEALLRYNAAAAGDRPRQAAADCVTAAVSQMLDLLLAGTVKKSEAKGRVRMGAVVLLLGGIICALAGALLMNTYLIASCVLAGVCAVCLFASGRLWSVPREISVSAGLDSDTVWKTIRRTGEIMDLKIDAFCRQEKAWVEELTASDDQGEQAVDPQQLQLLADLLEALYSGNGEYSLRQLKKLLPYLKHLGIETQDFDGTNTAVFELLPTKNQERTLRPALLMGDKLLLAGRAAEHVDG